MRPLIFAARVLQKLLLRDKVATLPVLKPAFGTDDDLPAFRKVKRLDYLTSYSHGGRSAFGVRLFYVPFPVLRLVCGATVFLGAAL